MQTPNLNQNNGSRIVLIGSTSVGKTSLITRIVEHKFDQFTTPTTGTSFFPYTTGNPDHPTVQLWDTAGMERYRALNRVFFREAVGAILVFDLTNYQSFEELNSWLNEFITESPPNSVVVLAGNKSDLSEKIAVTDEEIEAFQNEHQLKYFQTSAATGENVDDMLHFLLSILPKTTVETTALEPPDNEGGCC